MKLNRTVEFLSLSMCIIMGIMPLDYVTQKKMN
uniref:Uncharacterized protein n=1 Tax=Arundo donax TaxID=35708 RepID=A0A0A9H6R2_ARUDO